MNITNCRNVNMYFDIKHVFVVVKLAYSKLVNFPYKP